MCSYLFHVFNSLYDTFLATCPSWETTNPVLVTFVSNDKTTKNNELEMMWKKAVVASFLSYYPSTCLEKTR
jgi:hypothetical protein